MGRDKRKRSTAEEDGGGGDRKKERETKESDDDPVVVPPPTDDEVEEFFAILRRMREAVKYFEKRKGGVKLLDPSREVDGGEVSGKKRTGVAVLDLNGVPDEGE
ncbi:hypothetical protein SSX86_016886 [Deinandra increscens subsp. villosa]|uniref:Uncharacterized protein n=1 Tax=Deinandra increscens subsp. villosa TaxID=3103831 RepID=A0AAP0GV76_9ASTR